MNEKTAIVTGGSRGIGLATAKRLGLDGYNVVIFATRPKKDCEEQLKELEHLGICLHYVQGTLDHGEDRKRLIEETVKQFGRIDVLVNNAGVAPLVRADLLTMTEESYDRVMGINAKGTMFLTQLAANEMLKQEVIGKKRGTIVNVGSCFAEVSSVNRGEYCISKSALSMITTLFADRLRQYGVEDVVLVTENINAGTSRNTGSDKQTYYKLSLAGGHGDSVRRLAEVLFEGGCVDGVHALCEAALSCQGFFKLVELGVPFPHNRYGEFVGYKTDHDPNDRGTSVGPY